ncbi:unnamed protein product [Chrysoparadoxa australica]
MKYVPCAKPADPLEGHTLLLPIISTGNVGQLCVDLLLASAYSSGKPIKKLGYLDTPLLLPAVGYEVYPGQAPRLSTNLELFLIGSNIAVLQQRSPAAEGKEEEFCKQLMAWAKDAGIKEVVGLVGADDSAAATGGEPGSLHYFASHPSAELTQKVKALGIPELSLNTSNSTCGLDRLGGSMGAGSMGMLAVELGHANWTGEAVPGDCNSFPFGTGCLMHLVSSASGAGREFFALVMPCGEGDSTPVAAALAQVCNSVVGEGALGTEGGWAAPLSWNSLYGAAPSAHTFT